MRKYIYIFLQIFFVITAFAQVATKEKRILLVGKVADSFTKIGTSDAKVTLLTVDSTEIDTFRVMVFDNEALFSFRIPARKEQYILRVDHRDYETTYTPYRLKVVGRNTRLDLPTIFIKRRNKKKVIELGEVTVKATKVKVVHRGDTLVFNADAFNVAEGNMLDALIRQMPGVELKSNGEIFVNGKKVDFLLLNGQTFYKGNNKLMLDNLPYYMVQNVKVYNRTTDRALYSDLTNEKKDFVMDINLKRQYRQGYIANAEIGGGTEDSYIGRLFGLRFTDHSRLTLIGNLNNLNSDYTPEENGDCDDNRGFSRDGRTIRKKAAFGLRTNTQKLENNLEISTGWTKSQNEEKQYAETLLSTDSSLFSTSYNQRINHTFQTTANNSFVLKSPFYLLSNTSFVYEQNENASVSTYRSIPSSQDNRSNMQGHTLNLSQSFASTHKMAWGDVLDLNAAFSYMNRSSRMNEQMTTSYAKEGNQQKKSDVTSPLRTYNYQFGANYSIKDFNYGTYQLLLSYKQEQKSESDERYDVLNHQTDVENSYWQNQILRSFRSALRYGYERYGENKYTGIEILLPLCHERQRSFYNKSTLDTCALRQYWLFEPKVSFEYNRKKQNISVSAELRQSLPNVLLLIDRPNTIDPLHTYLSNPSLRKEKEAYFKIRYSRGSGQSQLIRIRAEWAQYFDRINQSYSYDASNGRFTFQPKNVNGNWLGNVNGFYSLRFGANSPFYICSETSVDVSRNSDFSGIGKDINEMRYIHFFNGKEMLNLLYDKNSTRIDLRGSVQWIRSSSNSVNVEAVNAFHYRYGVDVTAQLPLQLSLTSSLFMEYRRGYSTSSLNTNNCICNLTLGRSFLKGKRLLVRLTAVDLFHSYSTVSYRVSSSGRTETWSYSLPAYCLLRVGYKFDINPKK